MAKVKERTPRFVIEHDAEQDAWYVYIDIGAYCSMNFFKTRRQAVVYVQRIVKQAVKDWG